MIRPFNVSPKVGLMMATTSLVSVVLLWVAATAFGWVYSVAFISHVSMLALVLGCLSWVFSSRVEVRQDRDANVQDVVDRLDAKT